MATTRHFAVFDSDTHVVEPSVVWEKYLDPEFRVLGKQALWRHDGATNSYLKINGEVIRDTMNPNLPRHAIWRPGMTWDSVGELDASVRHPMNEGAWDPRVRLADMDAMGVDQAFLYPTWFAEGFHLVADPDTAYALARAYNDWIADFCRADPRRLYAAAMLPLQDMDYTLAELRRVAAIPCFRGAFIRPMFFQGHYFTSPYFDPLWAELERLGLVAAVHPTPGLWNPEWTSHGQFVEKVKNRAGQAPLPAGGGGPFSGGGAGLASTSFFTAFPQLGHPMAPILSCWLDNHMFVASVLIGFTVMQRFPGDEGRGRARQGVVDGGGAGEDGGVLTRDPAAAQIPGANRHRGDVGRGKGDVGLRRGGALHPEDAARFCREGRLGIALSPARHDIGPRRDSPCSRAPACRTISSPA